MKELKPYTKKYTNADFYHDGIFDEAVAKRAFLDMFDHYGIPFTPFLEQNFWVADFGLGDFENVGMGGVFWINNPEYRYFGHEIYLLPSQMIVEHYHVPSPGYPAKHESWLVRHGSVYGFSEVGEPNLDQFPEIKALLADCQKDLLRCVHVEKWEADGQLHVLPKDETWHFMMGGPNGAVVTEFGTFHDNNGLRFTVPGASL